MFAIYFKIEKISNNIHQPFSLILWKNLSHSFLIKLHITKRFPLTSMRMRYHVVFFMLNDIGKSFSFLFKILPLRHPDTFFLPHLPLQHIRQLCNRWDDKMSFRCGRWEFTSSNNASMRLNLMGK